MIDWFENHTTLFEVATYGVEVGELNSPQLVLHFFERPWLYEDLYREYEEAPVS